MSDMLESGYSVLLTHDVDGEEYPIYPVTRTTNVKNEVGLTVEEMIEESQEKLKDATCDTKGVVMLSDNVDDSSTSKAATIHSVSTVHHDVTELSRSITTDIQKINNRLDNVGGGSSDALTADDIGVTIPSLGEDGLIPVSQIPGCLDDVVDIEMNSDITTAYVPGTNLTVAIKPESGKLYIDVNNRKQWVWSGTNFAQTGLGDIVIGNTPDSAFRGDLGAVAYQHATSEHAKVNASVVTKSTDNGYILVDGVSTKVYTHPSGTNPHGLTKSDINLSNVENKSSATIRSEITSANVVNGLGYTPAKTDHSHNYLPLSGGTMSGDVVMDEDKDIWIKKNGFDNYISEILTGLLSKAGGTMTGELILTASTDMRLVTSSYGFVIRNNGISIQFGLTTILNPYATTFASYPISINCSTGSCTIKGNVDSATKLSTGRTFTIGNKSNTFDGSSNVTFTLSDIGAATSTHTHSNYLPLSGGTMTGRVNIPTNSLLTIGDMGLVYTSRQNAMGNTSLRIYNTSGINANSGGIILGDNSRNCEINYDGSGSLTFEVPYYSSSSSPASSVGVLEINMYTDRVMRFEGTGKFDGLSVDGDVDFSAGGTSSSNTTVLGGKVYMKNRGADNETSLYFSNVDASAPTYTHNCRIYGGNSTSTTSIGLHDSDRDMIVCTYRSDHATFRVHSSVTFTATGTVSSSDRRVKKDFMNLDDIDNLHNVFMDLKATSYRYKNGNSGRRWYGFVAQEVEETIHKYGIENSDFAAIVIEHLSPDDDDYNGIDDEYSLRYEIFIPMCVNEIQHHDAKIEELADTIDALREENKSLSSTVKTLQSENKSMKANYANLEARVAKLEALLSAKI